jgi:threonine dehydrogenase-like Zn-dependent dehydrogenase
MTEQGLSYALLDHLTDGLATLGGTLANLVEKVLVDRYRRAHNFLPDLIDRIWKRDIDPGKVFDLTLPLDQVAEGYKAMDERRAIKALLQP